MQFSGHACETPNDPKLSDGGGWRAGCMAGGKAAAEAASVTAGAVRCSAWLGDIRFGFAVVSLEKFCDASSSEYRKASNEKADRRDADDHADVLEPDMLGEVKCRIEDQAEKDNCGKAYAESEQHQGTAE